MKKNIYHRDGTVTYWSVYEQTYTREHAAMTESERTKVEKHAEKHTIEPTEE